jgi:hypothetical protein
VSDATLRSAARRSHCLFIWVIDRRISAELFLSAASTSPSSSSSSTAPLLFAFGVHPLITISFARAMVVSGSFCVRSSLVAACSRLLPFLSLHHFSVSIVLFFCFWVFFLWDSRVSFFLFFPFGFSMVISFINFLFLLRVLCSTSILFPASIHLYTHGLDWIGYPFTFSCLSVLECPLFHRRFLLSLSNSPTCPSLSACFNNCYRVYLLSMYRRTIPDITNVPANIKQPQVYLPKPDAPSTTQTALTSILILQYYYYRTPLLTATYI